MSLPRLMVGGGADDNLSLLEHSEANRVHSCGYYLKLHVTKVLVMLEISQGPCLTSTDRGLSLHSRCLTSVGRGSVVSCHPCHVWLSKNHSFLWENLLSVSQQKDSSVVLGELLEWHFSGMVVTFLNLSIWWRKNSFKLLLWMLP